MRVKRSWPAALIVAAGALASGAPALGAGAQDEHQQLADRDVRTAKLRPTAAQQDRARSVGDQVAWNQFGTPSTLVDAGGTLATGVSGATPEAAARAWVDANRALFRGATADGLELVSDAALAGDAGHAVTLRQVVGGLEAAGGGMLTVGVMRDGAGWKVISAAGTIHGDATLAGKATLAPQEAVQAAAADVGERRSLGQIDRIAKPAGERFKAFRLTGLADLQRTRPVAFPTVERGFVPAYETIVLDTESPEPGAYRTFVDGRDGKILARESLTHSAADEPTAGAAQATAAAALAAPQTFSGALPAADGGCAPQHGPYAVAAGAGVRAIDVFANADIADAGHRAAALPRHDARRAGRHPHARPSGSATRPPAACRPATTSSRSASSATARPGRAAHLHRHDHAGRQRPAGAVHRALARLRSHAAAQHPGRRPVEQPGHRHPRGLVLEGERERRRLRRGRRQPRVARAVGPRRQGQRDDEHDDRQQRQRGGGMDRTRTAAGPTQFRPVSPARDYTFPLTNAWNNADCNPGTPYGAAFVPGQSFDISAAVTNLFAQHNRMHDWSYLLGFTEENWNGQASNFGTTEAFRENDPVLGSAQAGATVPPAARDRPQQREHDDAARRRAVDHEHVPVAADRGRLLRALRRR